MSIPQGNLLLAALPPPVAAELVLAADVVTLGAGRVVHAGEGYGAGFVYFPLCGVISVRASHPSGEQVELASIGREGGFGLVSLLGVPLLPMVAEITLDVQAARLPLGRVREWMALWPEARPVILRFVGELFRDVVQSFGCFRFHTHDQWVARWLLTTADKGGEETLRITHDVIARRLGSQRHGVSATLAHMRGVGAIATDRGHISILSRSRLQALACSCYVPPESPQC